MNVSEESTFVMVRQVIILFGTINKLAIAIIFFFYAQKNYLQIVLMAVMSQRDALS